MLKSKKDSIAARPILIFESRAEKYIKIVKFGSIYASIVTSTMTAVLGIGSKLAIPAIMALDAPVGGLALATVASLGSSSLLLYTFRPFVTKILLERSDQTKPVVKPEILETEETLERPKNIADAALRATNPADSVSRQDQNRNQVQVQDLPKFSQLHKSRLKALQKHKNIAPTEVNTQFTSEISENMFDTVEVGPYTIDGIKQSILLNKYTKISLLTPSLSGLGNVKTQVFIADLRLTPGASSFKNWTLVENSSSTFAESSSTNQKNDNNSKSDTKGKGNRKGGGFLSSIFKKKLVHFSVIPGFSFNSQERQVVAQIFKLVTLNSACENSDTTGTITNPK